jgi:hypothetical protein
MRPISRDSFVERGLCGFEQILTIFFSVSSAPNLPKSA